MSELRKNWIAPVITGAMAAVIGGLLLTWFYPQQQSPIKWTDLAELPATFTTEDAPNKRDLSCYRDASECLKQQQTNGRARNGCEALPFWFGQFKVAKHSVHYSPVIDGCVIGVAAEAQNEWIILDVQGALGDIAIIFHCNRRGVDNVVVSAARKLEGKLFESS